MINDASKCGDDCPADIQEYHKKRSELFVEQSIDQLSGKSAVTSLTATLAGQEADPFSFNCEDAEIVFFNNCIGSFSGHLPAYYRASGLSRETLANLNEDLINKLRTIGVAFKGAGETSGRKQIEFGCLFDFSTVKSVRLPNGAIEVFEFSTTDPQMGFSGCAGIGVRGEFEIGSLTIMKFDDGPRITSIGARFSGGLDSDLSSTASFGRALRERYGIPLDNNNDPSAIAFQKGNTVIRIRRDDPKFYSVNIFEKDAREKVVSQLQQKAKALSGSAPVPKF